MINYSIIIPHKNIPDLLQKCLDSIPLRNDIQIIIVDDNSDPKIVDFEDFPGLNCPNTEVYFTKEGKGAGYARNIGLVHAKGRWIIFADADDFFNHSFNDALDCYVESDYDIIFFKSTRIKTDYILYANDSYLNDLIDKVKETGCFDMLLFGAPTPVSKFIKKDLIEVNNIKFQEVQWANDVFFSTMIGIYAKVFNVSDIPIYCIVERLGSLTKNVNDEAIRTRCLVSCNTFNLLKKINKEYLVIWWIFSWWHKLLLINKLTAIQIMPRIYLTVGVKKSNYEFLKIIKVEFPKFWSCLKIIKDKITFKFGL